MMRTAIFRLCGQASGWPKGVLTQSKVRINAPNSPPPDRNSHGLGPGSFVS